MSINVVSPVILGLDYRAYGVKRSWLPLVARFSTVSLRVTGAWAFCPRLLFTMSAPYRAARQGWNAVGTTSSHRAVSKLGL